MGKGDVSTPTGESRRGGDSSFGLCCSGSSRGWSLIAWRRGNGITVGSDSPGLQVRGSGWPGSGALAGGGGGGRICREHTDNAPESALGAIPAHPLGPADKTGPAAMTPLHTASSKAGTLTGLSRGAIMSRGPGQSRALCGNKNDKSVFRLLFCSVLYVQHSQQWHRINI